MPFERLAHGGVQGVDRAVALGHLVADLLADAELDGGLGAKLAVGVGLDVDVVAQPLEVRPERARHSPHQQGERAVGRLELVAGLSSETTRARISSISLNFPGPGSGGPSP